MLRFLKWIFFIFGGLGLLILTFFYIQNKQDLNTFFDNKENLSYESLQKKCLNIVNNSYYPCFKQEFDDYLDKVSLTGTSLGMKLAFNFLEEDRIHSYEGVEENERNIIYGLKHLDINNLALDNSYRRFFGLEFTYGGYIGKLKDFLVEAKDFSDGIIEGLKGKDGISSLKDETLKQKYTADLERIEATYLIKRDEVQKWLNQKVDSLKKKHNI